MPPPTMELLSSSPDPLSAPNGPSISYSYPRRIAARERNSQQTPAAATTQMLSPTKMTTTSSSILSPWRIKVVVEAERDSDGEGEDGGHRLTSSSSSSPRKKAGAVVGGESTGRVKRRYSRTIKVPLKDFSENDGYLPSPVFDDDDDDDDDGEESVQGRSTKKPARKTTTKSPARKRSASGGRVTTRTTTTKVPIKGLVSSPVVNIQEDDGGITPRGRSTASKSTARKGISRGGSSPKKVPLKTPAKRSVSRSNGRRKASTPALSEGETMEAEAVTDKEEQPKRLQVPKTRRSPAKAQPSSTLASTRSRRKTSSLFVSPPMGSISLEKERIPSPVSSAASPPTAISKRISPTPSETPGFGGLPSFTSFDREPASADDTMAGKGSKKRQSSRQSPKHVDEDENGGMPDESDQESERGEEEAGFDPVVPSEGFSMVSAHSLPNFLSSPVQASPRSLSSSIGGGESFLPGPAGDESESDEEYEERKKGIMLHRSKGVREEDNDDETLGLPDFTFVPTGTSYPPRTKNHGLGNRIQDQPPLFDGDPLRARSFYGQRRAGDRFVEKGDDDMDTENIEDGIQSVQRNIYPSSPPTTLEVVVPVYSKSPSSQFKSPEKSIKASSNLARVFRSSIDLDDRFGSAERSKKMKSTEGMFGLRLPHFSEPPVTVNVMRTESPERESRTMSLGSESDKVTLQIQKENNIFGKQKDDEEEEEEEEGVEYSHLPAPGLSRKQVKYPDLGLLSPPSSQNTNIPADSSDDSNRKSKGKEKPKMWRKEPRSTSMADHYTETQFNRDTSLQSRSLRMNSEALFMPSPSKSVRFLERGGSSLERQLRQVDMSYGPVDREQSSAEMQLHQEATGYESRTMVLEEEWERERSLVRKQAGEVGAIIINDDDDDDEEEEEEKESSKEEEEEEAEKDEDDEEEQEVSQPGSTTLLLQEKWALEREAVRARAQEVGALTITSDSEDFSDDSEAGRTILHQDTVAFEEDLRNHLLTDGASGILSSSPAAPRTSIRASSISSTISKPSSDVFTSRDGLSSRSSSPPIKRTVTSPGLQLQYEVAQAIGTRSTATRAARRGKNILPDDLLARVNGSRGSMQEISSETSTNGRKSEYIDRASSAVPAAPSTITITTTHQQEPSKWEKRHWKLLEALIHSSKTIPSRENPNLKYIVSIDNPDYYADIMPILNLTKDGKGLVLSIKESAAIGRFERMMEAAGEGGVWETREVARNVACLVLAAELRKARGVNWRKERIARGG